MLDRARGTQISGNPSFTRIEGNSTTIQAGTLNLQVRNLAQGQPGVASNSLQKSSKLTRWTPANVCKTTSQQLTAVIEILEEFGDVMPYKALKKCQNEEQLCVLKSFPCDTIFLTIE